MKIVKNKDVVVTDEIEEDSSVKKLLRKHKISLLLPLRVEKEDIGLLVLGEKKSGDIYTKEDIQFLDTLSPGLSLAIKNSQLYEKVLSDRERIEKLLKSKEELEKTKEKFISVSSSEIREPLLSTQDYLSKVDKEKLSPKALYFVEKTLTASRRSIKLLSKLIEAGELEHKKTIFNLEPTNIEDITGEVVEEFRNEALSSNLKLRYITSSKPLSKVQVDRKQIKKVISYLLENAIKFTLYNPQDSKSTRESFSKNNNIYSSMDLTKDATGFTPSKALGKDSEDEITVETKEDKNKVIISIKDNGVGIPKSQLSHIFEKFYQVDTSLTRQFEGTGLGLYVANLIVKAHKGEIKVNSTSKVGSEFRVELRV